MKGLTRTLLLIAPLLAAACVRPSLGPPPPRVEVLAADTRFGAGPTDVLGHPDLAPKIRALFGADWAAGAAARGGTVIPAQEFFGKAETPRRLRVEGQEHIALAACRTATCRMHRSLLLIQADGERLHARLDEAGYTHYYAFGVGAAVDQRVQALLDAVWAAVEKP